VQGVRFYHDPSPERAPEANVARSLVSYRQERIGETAEGRVQVWGK